MLTILGVGSPPVAAPAFGLFVSGAGLYLSSTIIQVS